MIVKALMAALFALLPVLSAFDASAGQDTMRFGRFGTVSLYWKSAQPVSSIGVKSSLLTNQLLYAIVAHG